MLVTPSAAQKAQRTASPSVNIRRKERIINGAVRKASYPMFGNGEWTCSNYKANMTRLT